MTANVVVLPAGIDARLVRYARSVYRRDVATLDVDDLCQIAREAALRALAAKPDATAAYLMTAARWRISDAYREELRLATVPDIDESAAVGDDFSDDLVERLDADAVTADAIRTEGLPVGWGETVAGLPAGWVETVAGLPAGWVESLVLTSDGMSYRDVAVKLAIPLGTVKSRRWRARVSLASKVAA